MEEITIVKKGSRAWLAIILLIALAVIAAAIFYVLGERGEAGAPQVRATWGASIATIEQPGGKHGIA